MDGSGYWDGIGALLVTSLGGAGDQTGSGPLGSGFEMGGVRAPGVGRVQASPL